MRTQDRPAASNEEELIQRAKGGDSEAFGDQYMLHLDRIYRYIFYRVGDAMEAEDLTEQVFLRASEAIGRYRLEGYPFSSWLYRIAHNMIVDHYRAKKDVVPLDAVSLTLTDDALSPEESLARDVEVTRLREALAQLTGEQQQLLLLRFVEGLSHAQVAQILGRREGSVRVMQHRALAALNHILEGS